jgi:hypothetical protein
MNSSHRVLWIVISGFAIGILADFISATDVNEKDVFLASWVGFALLIPLALLFISLLIKVTRLRNRFTMILFSSLMFLAVMFFGFWFYEFRHRPYGISDMYGLFYILGFLPAIVIGVIYGSLLPKSSRADKQ